MRRFYFKKSPPMPTPKAGSEDLPCDWPFPNFRLRVDDVSHPGAQLFFQHVKPHEALTDAAWAVFSWLYTPETVPRQ